MPTNNPRTLVTLPTEVNDVVLYVCKKEKMKRSAVIRKVMEDWAEEYEDMLLARRAEEAEREWIAGGCKTISHEDLCKELGL